MALGPQKPGRGAGGKELGADLRQRAEAERLKGTHATDELADKCQELEEELEELKAKYEMYFLGVERLEPVRWREEVKKKVSRLKSAFTRNTGLRFRMQTLYARYLSYERLWLRSAREKEEGTYHRDLFKARRHAKPPAPVAAAKGPLPSKVSEDVDLSDWGSAPRPAPAAAAPAPSRPAPSAPASPRPAPSGVPGETQLRELYTAYVTAKRRCNEDVSRLTYDAVARSVAKQVPELMARYKARSVEFKVVIRDGKAILKAVPKT